jgi:subtilisin family serine protease
MLLTATAGSIAAAPQATKESRATDVYLVRLAAEPALQYMGGTAGLARTAPRANGKLDPTAGSTLAYVAYLDSTHDALLARIGATNTKVYSYHYAVNGFAAVLNGRQVARLRLQRGVVSVEKDILHKATTENSPRFLGLTQAGSLWAQTELAGVEGSGEDVIVGVIDTGIWPEHPSFSDQSDLRDRPGDSGKLKRVYDAPPAYWHGTCQSGELWSQDDCNNKLIGARYFLSGFTKHGIIQDDYKSARDSNGHGSHTASTAAGNAGVQASIYGIARGTVSGMAPRARIAVYKGLWNDNGGFTSDLAAAVDAAVADGVDVINYSIGSSTPSFLSLDALAFLNAANPPAGARGTFVANSAGNDGPGISTVGAPAAAPWLMTVGASTQDRTFQGRARLGDAAGTVVRGASVTRGTAAGLPLVDAADAGGELCIEGTLDPAKVRGAIVLCKRGENTRVEKGHAVALAGGAGMILYNATATQDTVTDNHFVPAVHVSLADGQTVKAYIAAPGPSTAQLFMGQSVTAQGSVMADFSSRGPNGAAEDIIKPDVTAPGVNILAGNTPTPIGGVQGQLFQSISGTSMSSPHVAGIAALLVQLHRTWTPDQIKSALMVTARQDVKKEGGVVAADPFDMGAGHIVPNNASNPGLTFDAPRADYFGFLCGVGALDPAGATCTSPTVGVDDPSDLNLASIGIAQLAGNQTVTRTTTSVDTGTTTWTSSKEGLTGIEVTVPASLTYAPGQSRTWTAAFARTTAPLDEWTYGAIKWTAGDGRVVRVVVAVKPVPISAPLVESATATGATADLHWTVKSGYTGPLSADGYGLDTDLALAGQTVAQDADQDIATATFTSGVTSRDYTLAAGTRYFAAGTFEATTTANSDLDVYIFYDADDDGFTLDDLVAFSADGDSEEIAELVAPAAGKYRVVVHGWGTPGGAGSTYTFHEWLVNQATADSGTLTAAQDGGDGSVVNTGQTVGITAHATGLVAGQSRGVVFYRDAASVIGETVVIVDR